VFRYCLVFVLSAICAGAITFATIPSHRATSAPTGVSTWLVPGASGEVEALVIHRNPMPVLRLPNCPRSGGRHKPVQ